MLRSKRSQKFKKNRIRPNELIKKATQNMNKSISTKYQLVPETIEKRNLNPKDSKYFQKIYDFMRIKIIQNNQMRNDKYDQKIDKRKKNIKKSFAFRQKSFSLSRKT